SLRQRLKLDTFDSWHLVSGVEYFWLYAGYRPREPHRVPGHVNPRNYVDLDCRASNDDVYDVARTQGRRAFAGPDRPQSRWPLRTLAAHCGHDQILYQRGYY